MTNKIIKGETMSASRTRFSLLAGSSLAAASLLAFGGAALTPGQARAANECGGVGPATGTFDCTGTHAAISYTTGGNLTLRMNNGVATTTGGVIVNSSGAHTVTINRLDTPAGSGDPQLVSTSGAGLQVLSSGTGAVTVDLTDTDTGDAPLSISGTTTGVQLTGGRTSLAAIALTTTNGTIAAMAPTGIGVQTTSLSTVGGNTTLNLGGAVSGATGVQTVVNGTGSTTINLSAVSSSVAGGDVAGVAGPAVHMTWGAGPGTGAGTLTVGAGRLVRANGAANAVVEIANANGARTINNNGAIRSNDATTTGYDDLVIRVGTGAGAVTINNNAGATLSGAVTLSGSGAATIANAGAWRAAGLSALGGGAASLTNAATGVFLASTGGAATTIDFQAGIDTLTNNGVLVVGDGAQAAATLNLVGLEGFTNTGRILFGANLTLTGTDGAPNDRIVATNASFQSLAPDAFNLAYDSTLVMDVDFTGSQNGCASAIAADCLDIRGGVTVGQASILVNAVGASRGMAGRIVLVDVEGGFSDADRFILDPDSPGYAIGDSGEAVIAAGILEYGLMFDAASNQHFLLGMPVVEAFEPGLFPTFVWSAWDLATGTASDRGLELRDGHGDGGAWGRIVGAISDYGVTQSFTAAGVTAEYDTSYEQSATALVVGLDLVRASSETRAWVFGVSAGHVASDASFTVSPSTAEVSGYVLGGYGSFVNGPLFLDAVVNAARFDLTYDAPEMGVAIDDGEATSLGFQVEGGWRLAVPDMPAHVEPLLSLSYVRTQMEDLAFPDAQAAFENTGNLRAGVGLRISGDADMSGWTTRFSFTGRAWEEFNGETEVSLTNAVLDLPLTYDDPSDRLGEIGFAIDALGLGDRLSVHVGAQMQFKDGYEQRQLSLGARYAW